MDGKQLKKALKNNKKIYGTAILSTSPHWPEVVKQTGLDFVFIDTEHIPLGRETLAQMCQVYNAHGIPPIVRIPSPDPFEACKVLDGGATGILAPYIETRDQVKALVGAVKLRPLKGAKLNAILEKPAQIDPVLSKYLSSRNENNILLINIESVPAFENLNSLLTVPGLDGIIIGPHDLSCSLNIPEDYHNPVFQDAVLKIITSARDLELAAGIHLSEEHYLQVHWAKSGVNIILHSSDISLFGKTLNNEINEIRKALDDEFEKGKYRQKTI